MGIEENSELQVDHFDLLPDALLFEIFNRVEDAKSLTACAVLCKRFGDLVAQTHNVSLQITRRNTPAEVSKGASGLHMNKSKEGLIGRFIFRPIHAFLNRLVSRKPNTCCDDDEDNMFRLPNFYLNKFREIRCLCVKLPGHDGDFSPENGSGALLKWKAEFGKQFQSCVILGATGFHKLKNDGDVLITSNMTNKQLKKRVVWTISCLIASSARHHMLKQIVWLNGMIRDVKISDGSEQGTIEMTEEQVAELREEMKSTTAVVDAIERTKVPAVTIKMWYMPVVELPESGGVMKGATLAVIRPTETKAEKGDDVALAVGAFGDKFVVEAVTKLIDAKKSYTLEMNSF